MYNPKSQKAEEFISHEEILKTLEYAEQNKNNIKLIDEILEKANKKKGLTHREASVLLACDIEEKNQEIYALAEKIKKDIYGNRIVMFAPLYLSNYCVNGCVYCPYHAKNKTIPRKKLTQEEVYLNAAQPDERNVGYVVLNPIVDPGASDEMIWSVADKAIATVDEDGNLTAQETFNKFSSWTAYQIA